MLLLILAFIGICIIVHDTMAERRRYRLLDHRLYYIDQRLRQILAAINSVGAADTLEVFAIIDGKQIGVDKMNLKKGQRVELIAKATAKGQPAKLDGEVAYTVPEGLAIVDDGGRKFLQPLDDAAEGAVVLMADADGDLGEGVKPLHFEGAINILQMDADTLEITFGAAEDIPVAVPEVPAP